MKVIEILSFGAPQVLVPGERPAPVAGPGEALIERPEGMEEERFERAPRREYGDRPERGDRGPRRDRGDRADRGERAERPPRGEQGAAPGAADAPAEQQQQQQQ